MKQILPNIRQHLFLRLSKSLMTAAFVVLGSITVTAQVKPGVAAGLTHSMWSGVAMNNLSNLLEFSNGMVSTQPVNGVYAGVNVDIPLRGKISLQPGAYYAQKGFSIEGQIDGKYLDFLNAGASARVNTHYIDVPVLLKAEVVDGLQLYAGPQLSFHTGSQLKADVSVLGISLLKSNTDISALFNKTDISLTGGIGYTFDNGFSVNAAYDHGLSRLDKNAMTKTFSRTFKLGVGFRF